MRDCDGVEHFGVQRIGPELRRHRLHRACRVDEVRHQYDTAKIEVVRARSRESDVRFYEKLVEVANSFFCAHGVYDVQVQRPHICSRLAEDLLLLVHVGANYIYDEAPSFKI